MGWGDTAYDGNPIIQTPELDRIAREALRLDRFYAAAPVCTSDFFPTFPAAAGVRLDHPPTLDGRNVLPILEGKEKAGPGYIAFEPPLRGRKWYTDKKRTQVALVGKMRKILGTWARSCRVPEKVQGAGRR